MVNINSKQDYCDFCKKIWGSKRIYKRQFEYEEDEAIAIVIENNKPHLYVPVLDWYYSDTYMQLNYCPKCGRKL